MSSESPASGSRWFATLFFTAIASIAAIAGAIGWLDVQTTHSNTGDQMVAIGGSLAAGAAVLAVFLRPGARSDEWKKLAFLAIGIWPFATFGLFIGWRIAVSAEQLNACEHGYAEVCTELATRKERRGHVGEATALFEEACSLGDANGCLRLAVRSEEAGDEESVSRWYREACRGEEALACVRLARRLKDSDPSEALSLLQRACALDDASACDEADALAAESAPAEEPAAGAEAAGEESAGAEAAAEGSGR